MPVPDSGTGGKAGHHDSIDLRFLLDLAGFLPTADIHEHYEEIHIVPGIEYVPGSQYL